jgi:hypothetical protein
MPITTTVTVIVDVSELEKWGHDVTVLEPQLEQRIIWTGLQVAKEGREEANKHVPVMRGTLSESIKLMTPGITSSPDGFIFRSGITAGEGLGEYPEVMEFGRTPGSTPPPVDAIEDWIRFKVSQGQFDISGYTGKNRIRSAAFRLAKSIGHLGTRGRQFMTAASNLMHLELQPRVDAVVSAWAARLEKG